MGFFQYFGIWKYNYMYIETMGHSSFYLHPLPPLEGTIPTGTLFPIQILTPDFK